MNDNYKVLIESFIESEIFNEFYKKDNSLRDFGYGEIFSKDFTTYYSSKFYHWKESIINKLKKEEEESDKKVKIDKINGKVNEFFDLAVDSLNKTRELLGEKTEHNKISLEKYNSLINSLKEKNIYYIVEKKELSDKFEAIVKVKKNLEKYKLFFKESLISLFQYISKHCSSIDKDLLKTKINLFKFIRLFEDKIPFEAYNNCIRGRNYFFNDDEKYILNLPFVKMLMFDCITASLDEGEFINTEVLLDDLKRDVFALNKGYALMFKNNKKMKKGHIGFYCMNLNEAQDYLKEKKEVNITANNNGNSQGYLYFITKGCEEFVKIGYTTGEVEDRRKQLQTASQEELKIVKAFNLDNVKLWEKHLHRIFKKYVIKGEWFIFSDEIKDLITFFEEESIK